MATSITWGTKVINVVRADMLLVQSVPTEIRELDLDAFRLELKDLEDSEEGMPFLDTHNHNTTITVGGVTLARVLEIINGYTVTFEDGQYAVNLVGANSNVADVTNVNQVSVRSANSAGLTYSEAINEQSFGGVVTIDTTSGSSGTQFPRGTQTSPVSNITDALTIANLRNLEEFRLHHTLVLSSGNDLSGLAFKGVNAKDSIMVFMGGGTEQLSLENLSFTGTMNGYTLAQRCIFANVVDWDGGMFECVMNGNITVDSTATEDVSLFNCASGIPGSSRPVLDMNSSAANLQVRGYNGGMKVMNFDQGMSASFDIASGSLELDATCTSGTIVVRGNVDLTDNSGVGCTVICDGTTTNIVQAATSPIKDQTDKLPDAPASEDMIVAMS